MLMLLALKINGRNKKHQMISLCTVIGNIIVIKYYVHLSQQQQSLQRIHNICFHAINFLVCNAPIPSSQPFVFLFMIGVRMIIINANALISGQ